MSDIIIRKATEEDISKIAQLDILCFSSPWSESAFEHEIKENSLAFYIVAEIESTGQIIGYAGLWIINDEGHITNVAVDPKYRRKKLGFSIVKVLTSEAEKAGAKSFTLEVRLSNLGAIEMYEKSGFIKIGVRKGYYTDNNEDALIMWTEKK